jgi:hypothetical protein
MSNFSEVVEVVKSFDFDELQELNFITSKYLSEIERDKLFQSHKESVKEYQGDKLKFSSDFDELKKMLEE